MDTKFDPLWTMVREVKEQNEYRTRYKATMEELVEVNRYDSREEFEAVLEEAREKNYASDDRYGGTNWIEFTARFTKFYSDPA